MRSDFIPSLKTSRREFLVMTGSAVAASSLPARLHGAEESPGMVLLEAEQFDDFGGWVLDQQSMDQMGSPYLLAHGLGIPVKDATKTVNIVSPGTYRAWVRTRDWVAPWKAPGAPGKFQVKVNGTPLETTFGTTGAQWHWQDGGLVELGARIQVALNDLTGFEGRCDAVLFCKDPGFAPPNELTELTRFRRSVLGLGMGPEPGGEFDLVVAGGGIAGTCAALSAARNGLKVALVQDRPVLGGNGSSEVRVWPQGKVNQQPYPHLGDIVREIVPERKSKDPTRTGAAFGDELKTNAIAGEPRITLFTDQRVYAVEMAGKTIQAVLAQHTRTGRRIRLKGKLFADCTGDATVGYLAGADYEQTREGHQGMTNLWRLVDAADKQQVLQCECKDKTALSLAYESGKVAQPFPRCPWALDLSDKPFPGRKTYKGQWGGESPLSNLGRWFWESGFDMDPIADVERIRDMNLRAMYGAWDALKNVDHLYPNHRIGWAAYIAGKRESRRLLGDVILSADDFRDAKHYPDGCFPCTWHIDIHGPHPKYKSGMESHEFISEATVGKDFSYKGPYWAPYRCLYSRNISNLFMAGRDISVTHDGLGPVRVMKTCGIMGEVVGKAAAICMEENTNPRGVYERHWARLQARF